MSFTPSSVPSPSGDVDAAAVNPLLAGDPLLSPLEQDVLDEYTRLLENMNKLSESIAYLAERPAAETLDSLRMLERKTATVCTLLKASVYSIVLQQQIYNDGGGNAEGGEQEGVVDPEEMEGMMGDASYGGEESTQY
ncbi:hypothetical protein KEM55_004049 [Ascosphaera atra]|nr:hypothetical protein KEM55_004049 [Ascosphaera atra]